MATPDSVQRPMRVLAIARSITRLSRSELQELVIVLGLATWCELLVRRRPLPELARRFKVQLAPDNGDSEGVPPLTSLPDWAVVRLRIVRRVMRNWPVDGVCLRHALVAGHRVSTMNPVLRIGVARTDPGVVNAHAWLDIGGRSLDVEAGSYEQLSFA